MMTIPPPDHDPYRIGIGDRLLALLITIGLAAVLVKVSLLNNGGVLAPGLAVVLLVAILAIRWAIAPGQARSILSAVAVGVLLLAVLFGALLAFLLVALSNRGE